MNWLLFALPLIFTAALVGVSWVSFSRRSLIYVDVDEQSTAPVVAESSPLASETSLQATIMDREVNAATVARAVDPADALAAVPVAEVARAVPPAAVVGAFVAAAKAEMLRLNELGGVEPGDTNMVAAAARRAEVESMIREFEERIAATAEALKVARGLERVQKEQQRSTRKR